MLVYVARHGETDWNREGRYQGRQESNLTRTGLLQAEALARTLAAEPIDRIISSPLRRCTMTAWPLAQRLRIPVQTEARLVEISHGDWEGRLRDEIAHTDGATLRLWQSHPSDVRFCGGESLGDVLRRWRAFAARIVGKNVVVLLTHDVVVRLAILDATAQTLEDFWKPRVVNGGYARFEVADGTWRLLDECVDAHLEGLLVDTSAQAL